MRPHSDECPCCHGRSGDLRNLEPGNAASAPQVVDLYPWIDLDRLLGYNENGSARCAVRAPERRHDDSVGCCVSGADAQCIVHVPFTVTVKLKSIVVVGGGDDRRCWPSHMRAYINRDDIDFSNVDEVPCVQEWNLSPGDDSSGGGERRDLAYETKLAKFQTVHSLTLFFSDNFGTETGRDPDARTCIEYLGFRGMVTGYKRQAVRAVYEARPLATDSRSRVERGAFHPIDR